MKKTKAESWKTVSALAQALHADRRTIDRLVERLPSKVISGRKRYLEIDVRKLIVGERANRDAGRALVQQLTSERIRRLRRLNDISEGAWIRTDEVCALVTRIVGEAKSLLRQKFECELIQYAARQEPAALRVLNKRAIDEVCDRLAELSTKIEAATKG